MQIIKVTGSGAGDLTRLVARTCFFSGFSVQSFCLPAAGYVKFDKAQPLSRQEGFSDFLLVLDAQGLQEAVKHAKEKSVVILNAREKPKSPVIKKRRIRLYCLDATGIALNAIRKPAPDAVMLGALVKACSSITSKAARSAVGESRDLHMALDEGFRNVK